MLWTNVDAGKKKTAAFEPLIDKRAAALLDEVKAAYQLQAAQRGAPATEPAMTAEEREAANLVVEQVGGRRTRRRRGGRGRCGCRRGGGRCRCGRRCDGRTARRAAAAAGGCQRQAAVAAGRWPRQRRAVAADRSSTPSSTCCSASSKTALEIRDFLSGEFTPLPLADVMAVLRATRSGWDDQAGTEEAR